LRHGSSTSVKVLRERGGRERVGEREREREGGERSRRRQADQRRQPCKIHISSIPKFILIKPSIINLPRTNKSSYRKKFLKCY
jgi:hypothetical protein